MKNLFNLKYLWLNNLCWIGFGVVDLLGRFQNYRITKLHACMYMFFVWVYRMLGCYGVLKGGKCCSFFDVLCLEIVM